jgi:hypothetical protein
MVNLREEVAGAASVYSVVVWCSLDRAAYVDRERCGLAPGLLAVANSGVDDATSSCCGDQGVGSWDVRKVVRYILAVVV